MDNSSLFLADAIDIEQLLQRICVQRPYFALERPEFSNGRFRGSARADAPAGFETGPMRGADIARHSAIAGLCAAAMSQSDEQRRFYLAQQGIFRVHASAAPYGTAVDFSAEVTQLDRRQAAAHIRATCNGSVLAELSVRYAVLTRSAFQRLFAQYRQPTPVRTRMTPLAAGSLHVDPATQSATRHVPHIGSDACAGHFDQFPAMPVAVMMGELGNLAATVNGDKPWRVDRAVVSATDLVWAGEPVTFRAAALDQASATGERSYECATDSGNRPISSMTLTTCSPGH